MVDTTVEEMILKYKTVASIGLYGTLARWTS